MYRSFIFRTLLTVIFSMVLPLVVEAKNNHLVVLTDTVKVQPQDKKKEQSKEKPDHKPNIKEVPKARKQSRPTVVKPIIKVKPIKIIRPNIKKP